MRDATAHDAAACAAIYSPYVTDTAISFESDPPSVAVMAERITAAVRTHAWVVLEVEGRVCRRIGWKHGAWHDVAWTQRTITTGEDPAAEPR